jgi:hypothetical protein
MLMTDKRPKWIGWKVPGDIMIFWWPANTDPDIYDVDQARAMDMAVTRYRQLYGEAPDAEMMGKLVMVTDIETYG